MKLTILCVGRLKDAAEAAVIERYLERLAQIGAQFGLGPAEVIELPESRARTARERKVEEAAAIRRRMPAGSQIFALDEHGPTLSSPEFSEKIRKARDFGLRNLCFIIGGPDGLDPDFVQEAKLVVSFGRMTMPHGLVRAVLAEQLYRAATIIAGHPYHRD